MTGRDELSGLADVINGMLEALEHSQRNLHESEERYRAVVEQAAEGIFLVDADTKRLLEANAAFQKLFGYTSAEIPGLTLYDVVAHDRESIDQNTRRILAEKHHSIGERRYRRKDGSLVDVEVSVYLVSGGEKEVLCAVVRDITERKRAEEALRESQQLLTKTFAGLRDAVFIVDADTTEIMDCNPAASELFGYSRQEMLGRTTGFLHVDQAALAEFRQHLFPAVAEKGFLFLPEFRMKRKDGTVFPTEHSVVPLEDERGQRIGWVSVVRDITERKQAEEALRRRAEELAALHTTSLDITAPHDLPTLLHTIVERAARLLDAPSGGMYLCDPDRQEVRYVVTYNTPRDYTGVVLKYGEGAAGTVAQTGQPLIIDDYRTWPGRAAVYEKDQPFTAVLSAPLIWQGRVIGVIHVMHNVETRRFTPADLELLTLFANQAAIAIENARLLEAAQRRAEEAETLRQAGAVVVATLRQDQAIERILEQLARVVPYDSASVQLLGEGYLEIVGGHGWPDPAVVVGLRFPVPADNPNTVVIQQRRPYILGDAPAAHAPFRQEPHSHIRSWLGVPLIVHDRVVGMLAVDSTRPDHFTPDHARLAAAFADQVAIAIENTRLYAEMQAQAAQRARERDQLAGLYWGLTEIARTDDVETILQLIADFLHAAGWGRVSVSSRDPETFSIIHLVTAGMTHEEKAELRARALPGHAWLERFGPKFERWRHEDWYHLPYRDPEVRALNIMGLVSSVEVPPDATWHPMDLLYIPMRNREGKPIGLVVLDNPADWQTPILESMRPIQLFLRNAALMLENRQLERERAHQLAVLRTVHETATVMSSSLDLAQILETVVNQLVEAFKYPLIGVYLAEENGAPEGTPWLRLKAQYGYEGCGVLELIFPYQGVIGRAIRTRRPQFVPDVVLDGDYISVLPEVSSEIAVPLVRENRVVGVINVESTADRPLTARDLDLLVLLGEQLTPAIVNAQLHAEVQRLAITDALTDLYNRRGLFELGRREVERARRFGRPLAAILLDLDDLKRVNDTYGHAVGDQVLVGVAARCRQELREVDLLGRYGGDEFAILLPESDLAGARLVAERLRGRIGYTALNTERGPITMTLSLGVVALNGRCTDLEALLERADQALYVAKQTGRDRVCVWQG
jgi:diguanylate cyclase (GGDEF)-like protein/PAS domain S-box-containing protein